MLLPLLESCSETSVPLFRVAAVTVGLSILTTGDLCPFEAADSRNDDSGSCVPLIKLEVWRERSIELGYCPRLLYTSQPFEFK